VTGRIVRVVAAASLVVACDDAPRPTTTAEEFLRTLPRTLDPKAPGPAELPGDLLPMPFPWAIWTLVVVAALVATTVLVRRRMRRTPVAPSTPTAAAAPAPLPHERALRRLAELRARVAASPAEVHVEASSVVRDYVRERFDVRAAQMTSEQLTAAMSASLRPRLADVLARCDAVKFACDAPGASDAERLLATAETFVNETTSAGGAS